ncbi:hypothetical protein [Rhizobium sp. S163]|uniref:hypothetical protein n=1 Tax=Rhizobium sp. S163 TaxID=3055039 RepID=UPI0025A9C6B6|nr:hypothetical protein [Rhizobium sp. S163]MDM9647725.1 hypothetical protein [Rhizobium sp. S163]
MSSLNSKTAVQYEEMLADVARQEGFKVRNVDGALYFEFSTWTPDGQEVAAHVNLSRFANAMARSQS